MKEFIDKLIGRLEEIYNRNDKAKKEAYEEQDWEYFDLFTHRNDGVYTSISIINKLAEEYNNGWIPCSERLPEDRDWCLVVFQEGDSDFVLVPRVAEYIGRETVCTTNEGWLIIDMEDEIGINAYYKNLKCIAWQPLPQPYKEGSEENG